ncbi:2Fe-2S iron-sulfur cluster-binding protein [Rhodococcus koreensis]
MTNMIRMTFVQNDGTKHEVSAEQGTSMMKAATANLVAGIVGECGGELSCATCHVFVDEAWASRVTPKTDVEEEMLEVTAAEPTEFSRLCCQIFLDSSADGVVVHIPEIQ